MNDGAQRRRRRRRRRRIEWYFRNKEETIWPSEILPIEMRASKM